MTVNKIPYRETTLNFASESEHEDGCSLGVTEGGGKRAITRDVNGKVFSTCGELMWVTGEVCASGIYLM